MKRLSTITEFIGSNLESLKLSKILKFFYFFLSKDCLSFFILKPSFSVFISVLYLPVSPSPITPHYCQTLILKISDTRNEIFKTGGNEKTFFSMLPFHWPSPQMQSHAHTWVHAASFTQKTSRSTPLPPDAPGYKNRPPNPTQFQNPPPSLLNCCLDNSNSQGSLFSLAPIQSA